MTSSTTSKNVILLTKFLCIISFFFVVTLFFSQAILHTCKLQKVQADQLAAVAEALRVQTETIRSTPPSPTSSPPRNERHSPRCDDDKMAAAASMLDLNFHRRFDMSKQRDGSTSAGPPSASSTGSSSGQLHFSSSPVSGRDSVPEST